MKKNGGKYWIELEEKYGEENNSLESTCKSFCLACLRHTSHPTDKEKGGPSEGAVVSAVLARRVVSS